MNNQPIGVFDSGIGGLTVAREIVRTLPNESIIYLGDTARIPYGTRSKEVVTRFAKELMDYLLKQDVKALVVACNTISATCLEELQEISPVPVLGVIKPAAKLATKTTQSKVVGVIGTRGTVGSKAYDNEIAQLDNNIKVISQACTLFVPIAEEGLGNDEVSRLMADKYLAVFNGTNVDTLILGCTHFPLLRGIIQQSVGNSVRLIDSAQPTAKELKSVLEEKGLLSDNNQPNNKYLVTDAPQRVLEIASLFFGKEVFPEIEKVSLY